MGAMNILYSLLQNSLEAELVVIYASQFSLRHLFFADG